MDPSAPPILQLWVRSLSTSANFFILYLKWDEKRTKINKNMQGFGPLKNRGQKMSVLLSTAEVKRPRYYNGGSPGLVVMGGDSCSKGHGFISRCRILYGHNIFSHIFVIRIVMFVWGDENKQKKRPRMAHFLKGPRNYSSCCCSCYSWTAATSCPIAWSSRWARKTWDLAWRPKRFVSTPATPPVSSTMFAPSTFVTSAATS